MPAEAAVCGKCKKFDMAMWGYEDLRIWGYDRPGRQQFRCRCASRMKYSKTRHPNKEKFLERMKMLIKRCFSLNSISRIFLQGFSQFFTNLYLNHVYIINCFFLLSIEKGNARHLSSSPGLVTFLIKLLQLLDLLFLLRPLGLLRLLCLLRLLLLLDPLFLSYFCRYNTSFFFFPHLSSSSFPLLAFSIIVSSSFLLRLLFLLLTTSLSSQHRTFPIPSASSAVSFPLPSSNSHYSFGSCQLFNFLNPSPAFIQTP